MKKKNIDLKLTQASLTKIKNLGKYFLFIVLVQIIIFAIYSFMKPPKETTTLELGAVELNVKDLEKTKYFYKDLVGLNELESTDSRVVLGDNDKPLIILYENKNLDLAPTSEAGLYHTALVFDSRKRLAVTLERMFEKVLHLYQGSADHLVTEAFYFADPEGNGVEIYFDKPKSDWQYDENGNPIMGSIYIDADTYIDRYIDTNEELSNIRMGHVHLKVGDIIKAKEFYSDILMFEIMNEMPTALFVSKDKYHHHLGINTWESFAANKRKDGLTGLRSFEIQYLNKSIFEQIEKNLKDNQIEYNKNTDSIQTFDPWGTKIILALNS